MMSEFRLYFYQHFGTNLDRTDGVVAFGTASRALRPARTAVQAIVESFLALLVAVFRVAAPKTVEKLDSADCDAFVK